jgi:hypothetical protein
LPGKALAVGVALWFLRGVRRSYTVTLGSATLEQFGVDRFAKYRALKNLEQAGLVRVKRRRKKNPVVTILEVMVEDGKEPAA